MAMGNKMVAELDFGGDMSANRRTVWIPMLGCRRGCLEIAWPATGTPVGVIAVEVSNHGQYGVAGTVYTPAIATQPAGTANSVVFEFETGAAFIAVTYTAGSGGTGASFTDLGGDSPRIYITE